MTCYWYDLRSKASYEGFGQTRCSCSTVHTLISYLIDRWQHNPDSHDKIYRGTKNHMWKWQYLLDVSQTKKNPLGKKNQDYNFSCISLYIHIFILDMNCRGYCSGKKSYPAGRRQGVTLLFLEQCAKMISYFHAWNLAHIWALCSSCAFCGSYCHCKYDPQKLFFSFTNHINFMTSVWLPLSLVVWLN